MSLGYFSVEIQTETIISSKWGFIAALRTIALTLIKLAHVAKDNFALHPPRLLRLNLLVEISEWKLKLIRARLDYLYDNYVICVLFVHHVKMWDYRGLDTIQIHNYEQS